MKRPVRKKFTKAQRELVCEIAQEAHMLGRLYSTGGEKRGPALEFARVSLMASGSLKAGRVIFNLAAAATKEQP